MSTTDTPDIIALTEQTVRKAFDRFDKPDDDWLSTLMFTDRRGRAVMVVIEVALPPCPCVSCDQDARDAAAADVERTLAAAHAGEAVWVTSCWVGSRSDVRPSLDPDRGEAITMLYANRDGSEMYSADVQRFDDRPPRLGPFTLQGTGLSGRFGDAMRRGIGTA